MKNTIWLLFLLIFIASCKTDTTEENTLEKSVEPAEVVETIDENFISDTVVIHNVFDETQFENDTLMSLLAELKICNTDVAAKFNINRPPCEPRFYKFFKYNKNMDWKDGFALEIRAGVEDIPLRRFLVFKRIDGKLVKLNGFMANLVEMHTTPSHYNDLMLLFRDMEAGSFVVKFKFNKNEVYEFKSLEAVDGYLVKPALKDSLSKVVLKRLEKNKMFF